MNSAPIYTYNADGDFEEPTDVDWMKSQEISKTCQNGGVHELETILNLLEPDKIGRYLNTMVGLAEFHRDLDYSYFTPLMIASRHGQDSIVRFLLENHSQHCIVDAQSYTCSYDLDDFHYHKPHFDKKTALWLAVKTQHLNVVQTLISLGKANVNHKAHGARQRNLTPLGLACINGQLEMVKYLLENGANLYDVNEDESTSLMIASACGHYDIVEYLLSVADSSDRLSSTINKKGSTALHAATYGYVFVDKYYDEDKERKSGNGSHPAVDRKLDIVKLLLEQHHAKIVKNKDGYTPLTIASFWRRKEFIEYYLGNEKKSWYTISQVIDEFELVGSRYVSKPEESYRYLMQAMRLRYRDPNAPILKINLVPPIDAYEYCQECQTIGELESIRDNRHRLTIECLMIQERRDVNWNLTLLLRRHAKSTYRSREEYQRALQLYLHLHHLEIKNKISLDMCRNTLEDCVSTMNEMIRRRKTEQIPFDAFLTILEASKNEFLKSRNLPSTLEVKEEDKKFPCSSYFVRNSKNYHGDEHLYIIRNLLFIGTEILRCSDETEQEQRRAHILRRVRELTDSDYRTLHDNKTLLHLSLMDERNYSYVVNIEYSPKFPSLAVVKLLLSCGAPINAIDFDHKTPLHQLAENKFCKFPVRGHYDSNDLWDFSGKDLSDLEMMFETLVNAGAHLDAIAGGKTPADCAKHKILQDLFRTHSIELSLKCICARAIQHSKLNFTNRIPAHLQSFVQLH